MIFNQIFRKILRSKATTLTKSIIPLFSAGFLVCIFLLMSSCSTSRHVQTVPIETVLHDTLYINKQSYDSIYIDNSHLVDRGGDTVYIKDKLIEYRYRLLRDTIRISKCDSIPYEVRITKIKEVKYIPPWIKPLALIGIITILVLLIIIFTKLKRF